MPLALHTAHARTVGRGLHVRGHEQLDPFGTFLAQRLGNIWGMPLVHSHSAPLVLASTCAGVSSCTACRSEAAWLISPR